MVGFRIVVRLKFQPNTSLGKCERERSSADSAAKEVLEKAVWEQFHWTPIAVMGKTRGFSKLAPTQVVKLHA